MSQQPVVPHGAPIHGNHNLPVHPPDRLFGRDADIASVHLALKAGTAVLLHGPAGAGKTALAAALAAGYAELPGGVLWFDTANDTIRSLLNRVARAYTLPIADLSDDTSAQTQAIHDLLQQNHPLVVLDGHLQFDAAREFVRLCASGIPLLLTHSRLVPGPWTPYNVGLLSEPDAEAMLMHLSEMPLEAELTSISQALAGHPLSIFVAARQFATGSIQPADLLSRINEIPTDETSREIGVLMTAYRLLPSTLQGMVLLLGTAFAGGASEELLSDVSNAPANVIRTAMRQLVTRGFALERAAYDQPYFAAHELVQVFAQAFLQGKQQLDTMRLRHLRGLLTFVRRYTSDSSPVNQNRLATEIDNILAASVYAAQHQQALLQELVQAVTTPAAASFVTARGFQPEFEWLSYLLQHPEAAPMGLLSVPRLEIAEVVKETPPDVTEEDTSPAQPIDIKAAELAVQGQPEALLSIEEARSLQQSAQQLAAQGNTAQAISQFSQALATYRANGDVADELEALEALATLSLQQENAEAVLTYVDQGMALAQKLDNPQREGHMLTLLGDLQAMLGHDEGAEVAYQEAINALRPTEAWLDIGVVLDKLASLYLDMGRSQDAVAMLEQTISIFDRIRRDDHLLTAYRRLGDVHARLMNWDKALTYHTQALELIRESGDSQAVLEQMKQLGQLSETSGDRDGAQSYYRQALGIAFKLQNRQLLGEALLGLGRLLMDDTPQLNRVVQLLEAANENLPGDTEIQRLLRRAKARQERLVNAGVALLDVEENLEDYAREIPEIE